MMTFAICETFVIEKEAGAAVILGGGRVLISRRNQQEFTQRLLKILSP